METINKTKISQKKGFYILLFAGFLYSLYGIFSRIIGNSIDPFFQFASRGVIISTLLLLTMYFTKISVRRIKQESLKWVIVAAGTSGILVPTFFIAINNLPIGTMLFIFYALSTVVGYVLGRVFLKEYISKVKAVSLILAIAGLFLMFIENINLGNGHYMFIAVLSGASFGTNISFVRKLSSHYHALQITLFNWLGVIIINIPLSLILHEHWFFSFTSTPWIANIVLAVCSLGASLSAVYGFKLIEVQKGSIILLSELIFGVIIGYIFYRETPTMVTLLGSILVFVALLLPNISSLVRKTD